MRKRPFRREFSPNAEEGVDSNCAGLTALRAELQYVEREMWELRVQRADLTARLKEREQWIEEVRESFAWKLIKPLWKLQRHFSRKRRDSPLKKDLMELVFGVDAPETSATPSKLLCLEGWCFSHGGPEVVGVRARVDGKSYFARYGLKRDKFGSEALEYPASVHTGFSVTISLAENNSTVFLEAITQGGSWQCFFSQPMPGPTSAQPQPSIDLPTTVRNDGYETIPLYPSIEIKDVGNALRSLVQDKGRAVSEAPFFSVITALFDARPRWIIEAGASLLRQTFPDWEWCILVPPSHNSVLRNLLEQLREVDGRFLLLFPKDNSPSQAINGALEVAAGEAVCFLEPQDVLHPEALAAMDETLREGYDIVYSDEDKFDENTGKRREPFFKPDWSPEYLRGTMYAGHLLTVRRDLARRILFNRDYDGIHLFEFMLRATETGTRVGHIPRTLYHSRKAARLITAAPENENKESLQKKAVNEQLQRRGLFARAEVGTTPLRLKVVPAVPRTTYPKISVIIPTKDAPKLLSRCLSTLHRNTSYPAFETILVDNETSNLEALQIMREYPVIHVDLPNPFNFSRANNLAVKHATGEYLVFLNNDTEIIEGRWLDHLLYYAEQSDIGAVGALLLHDDGTIQHGGVILGIGGTADHAMRGFSAKSDGYLGSLSCAREVSAVTGACMMMRRSLFNELGGFDERFSTMYQDVDLCLRLRERGLRIIWTPQALLLHHESVSRSKYYDNNDRDLLLDRWQQTIERGDPYYNRNLNLKRGDYGIR